jgi:predicted methyltransferase
MTLGFLADESFDLAIADPPYSTEESELLYSMPPPRWGVWTAEAVRVLRPGGHLAIYLDKQSARPAGTRLVYRIALWTRTWHTLRAVQIFEKLTPDESAAW